MGGLLFAPNAQAAGAAATGPSSQGPLLHGHQAVANAQEASDQAVEGSATRGAGSEDVLAGQPEQGREPHTLLQGECFSDGDHRGAEARGF